jgi:hypothetical protein
MLAGSATSTPSVVTSMMLAVSASQLFQAAHANEGDGVRDYARGTIAIQQKAAAGAVTAQAT